VKERRGVAASDTLFPWRGLTPILDLLHDQVGDQIVIQVDINEIKAKLSKYLAAVAKGETVVISRRNVPVAEIRPVAPARTEPRAVGQGPREEGYELPEAF
jgi:prevent-host-death family protein